MRELFIYFRAPARDDVLVHAAINTLQNQLRLDWPGLNARCLHRPDAQDGLRTWMEVYSMLGAGGVSPSVQAAIETAAQTFVPLWAGTRHVEIFVSAA